LQTYNWGEKAERRFAMPHYVYVCGDCRKEFTAVLHIADLDTAHLKCPYCGSEKIEPQVTEFAPVTSKKS
jgi:putative FmdB family regulatory protein